MQDVDQRLTKDVDRLCSDLADLIPTMVGVCTWLAAWVEALLTVSACAVASDGMVISRIAYL